MPFVMLVPFQIRGYFGASKNNGQGQIGFSQHIFRSKARRRFRIIRINIRISEGRRGARLYHLCS